CQNLPGAQDCRQENGSRSFRTRSVSKGRATLAGAQDVQTRQAPRNHTSLVMAIRRPSLSAANTRRFHQGGTGVNVFRFKERKTQMKAKAHGLPSRGLSCIGACLVLGLVSPAKPK